MFIMLGLISFRLFETSFTCILRPVFLAFLPVWTNRMLRNNQAILAQENSGDKWVGLMRHAEVKACLLAVRFATVSFARPFSSSTVKHAPLFAPRLPATSKNPLAHTFTFPINTGLYSSTANKRSWIWSKLHVLFVNTAVHDYATTTRQIHSRTTT
jgi:hypothetical protein